MSTPVLFLAVLGAGSVATLAALRVRRFVIPVTACGLLLTYLHGKVFFDVVNDDAFISFRYAENFANGHGLVWNIGEEAVEGYTNFLWVVMLAGFSKLGFDLPAASQWLGFGLSGATLLVLYELTRLWAGRADDDARTHGMVVFVLTVIFLAASGSFAYWTFGGLEVPLFAFLLTLAAYLHLREEAVRPRVLWSGPVLAALALTRPDGAVFFGVTLLFKVAGSLRTGLQREQIGSLVLWVLSFGLIFGGWFIWRYQYYGFLLPNTFYVKAGGGFPNFDLYERGFDYVLSFWRLHGGFMIFPLPVMLLLFRQRVWQSAYLMSLLLAWAIYLVYAGGDFQPLDRFFAQVLPILYFLVAEAFWSLFQLIRHSGVQLRPALALGCLAIVVLLGFHIKVSDDERPRLEILARQEDSFRDFGLWLRANAPPSYTMAVIAAGAMPYYSQLPTIDMLGLSDAYIAHLDVATGTGRPGHEKYDAAYVLERRPELIILNQRLSAFPWDRARYIEASRLPGGARNAKAALHDLIDRPFLWHLYEDRSVRVADGRYVNFLILKGRRLLPSAEIPAPPALLFPRGVEVDSGSVTLAWQPVAGADRYELRYWSAGLIETTRSVSLDSVSRWILDEELEACEEYAWTVRAGNVTGWGEWSPRARFTVDVNLRCE